MAETKYKELLGDLRARILAGEFSAETPFPSASELARELNLSRNTVHRAYQELRRQRLVTGGPGSRPRVVPQGMPRKIGLMVPGLAYSEFFQPIVAAIARRAMKSGYTLFFGSLGAEDYARGVDRACEYAQSLVDEGVAGVIYQPLEFIEKMPEANAAIMAIFDAARIPVVLIDYDIVPPPERSAYDLVGIDNFSAGYRLAGHLLAQGVQRIDFVMRPRCSWSVTRRLEGVKAAAARAGVARVRKLEADPDDAAALARFFRQRRPEAVVCANDTIAARVKRTAEGLGWRVPDDILLAGFDDVQLAGLLSPPLTTIRQPCPEIGEAAFLALLRRINTGAASPRETYLDAPLIVRASTLRNNGKELVK